MTKVILTVITCAICFASLAQNVGIGTTNPVAKLHVVGSDINVIYAKNMGASGAGIFAVSNVAGTYGLRASSSNGIAVFGESVAGTGVKGYGNNAGSVAVFGSALDGTGVKAFSFGGTALEVIGKVSISGGNTNPSDGAVLTSDADGNAVWQKNKIGFKAMGIYSGFSSLPENTDRKVHFAHENYDFGSCYNLLASSSPASNSSTFTAPVSGIYHFDAQLLVRGEGLNSLFQTDIRLQVNRAGTVSTLVFNNGSVAVNDFELKVYDVSNLQLNTDVYLLKGDIVWLEIAQIAGGDGKIPYTSTTTAQFSGHLVFED